ncbi:hypothetical protein ACQVQY_31080 [Bacillus mycoides]
MYWLFDFGYIFGCGFSIIFVGHRGYVFSSPKTTVFGDEKTF